MNRHRAVLPPRRRDCRSALLAQLVVANPNIAAQQEATRGTGPQTPPSDGAWRESIAPLLQSSLVKTVKDHVISGKGAWCRPSVATGAKALFSQLRSDSRGDCSQEQGIRGRRLAMDVSGFGLSDLRPLSDGASV